MAHDARLARRIIQRLIAHPGPRVELMMYLQNKPETWGPRGRDLRLLLEPDAEVFMHTSSSVGSPSWSHLASWGLGLGRIWVSGIPWACRCGPLSSPRWYYTSISTLACILYDMELPEMARNRVYRIIEHNMEGRGLKV